MIATCGLLEPTKKKGGAMAVVGVTALTVKPNRFEDYLDLAEGQSHRREVSGLRTSECWLRWWQARLRFRTATNVNERGVGRWQWCRS